MLEGFKINCFPLNRSIRISIHLPKDYNNTSRYYPVIYCLDGQNLYKDEESYRDKAFHLEEMIEKLSEAGKDAIFIGIAAASHPERREKEYQETILADFITSSIHPYLSSRYRMNHYIYALGCAKACYTALLLNQNELFKGALLFAPEFEMDKVNEISLPNSNLCYIYVGKQELDGLCLSNATYLKNRFSDVELQFDENKIHNEEAWRPHLLSALNYLVL
ncbi:MAG: hypothetical protein K2P14_11935 [Anaeroplasmataceae bacterium]|nr:hypothetical protein [Anaeroplasmataceae bacterium]